MNVSILSLPDDPALWGSWLDDRLVSGDLLETIVELEVLGGTAKANQSAPVLIQPSEQDLMKILGAELKIVLNSGLDSASEKTVSQLMKQPDLLLELQQEILSHGGEFWEQKLAKADAVLLKTPKTAPVRTHTDRDGNGLWGGIPKAVWILVPAGLAAMLLWMLLPFASSPGWGFSESGLLAVNKSEKQLLKDLAGASHKWFAKEPKTAAELANRIEEYRVGCQLVIDDPLSPLSIPNRQSVVTACQQCLAALTRQAMFLKNGSPYDEVQRNVDEEIESLEATLRALG